MAKLHKYVPQTPVTMFLYAVQKPSKCAQINGFPKQRKMRNLWWALFSYKVTDSSSAAN